MTSANHADDLKDSEKSLVVVKKVQVCCTVSESGRAFRIELEPLRRPQVGSPPIFRDAYIDDVHVDKISIL